MKLSGRGDGGNSRDLSLERRKQIMSVPESLGQFIAAYEALRPDDVVRITKPINSKFEITAIAKHFEEQNKFPLIVF